MPEEKEKKQNHVALYTHRLAGMDRPVLGRDEPARNMLAAFCRPEMSNVILIGEPGCGKTTLMVRCAQMDTGRDYREVDPDKMIANLTDPAVIGDRLKTLFEHASLIAKKNQKEIVLFLDEFHRITSMSPSAVEALKPMLANSNRTGVRFVCATTYKEYLQYIAPNQPLVERLQRFDIDPPGKETTISILKSILVREKLELRCSDHILEQIYDATEKYVPADVQPRKSIRVLLSMIGWNIYSGERMDKKLLNKAFWHDRRINLEYTVNASEIKKELDSRVFAQDFATSAIEEQLQLCVAGMNDKSRPMASFLFCGSTGVGKTEMAKQMARILFNDPLALIRFDMSVYSAEDSVDSFRRELTNAVWSHPNSIIMLDELEKSCKPVTMLLMSVLDDAILPDMNNRMVAFNNCYIIMTTNSGAEIFREIARYDPSDKGSASAMAKYNNVIETALKEKKAIPPELLGRINRMVPFYPLAVETQKKIVRHKLNEARKAILATHGVHLRYNERKLVDFVVLDRLDTEADKGGARRVNSILEMEIIIPICREINQNPDAEYLEVTVEGVPLYEDLHTTVSSAYIKVTPFKPQAVKKKQGAVQKPGLLTQRR